jgi:hypothetical protein
MATLRTLASVGSVCGRVTKLTDAARQVRSMARRRWRVAVGALCGFAFGVLSGVEAHRTLSRNRKERRQLLRALHPRHLYLRRLRVGSSR